MTNSLFDKVQRELARRKYEEYLEYVGQGMYSHARHTRIIASKLQDIIDYGNKKYIFTMPPRHSKSETITNNYPSYYLQKNPTHSAIIASYSSPLAERFNKHNRSNVERFGLPLFGQGISQTERSKNMWKLENGIGGCMGVGLGGAITGFGANLMLIDDPHKNRQEAQSPRMRDYVWEEYESTLRTRLMPNASIIVVQTRWHEDDLAGRLLASDEDFELISFPVEAMDNDILGREKGEPLWAEFGYGKKWLEETKRVVDKRTFASLYQQSPIQEGGNIFKQSDFRYYSGLPAQFDKIIQSWDFAFKGEDTSDYVVGQVWGLYEGNAFLLYQVREQADFVRSLQLIRNVSSLYDADTIYVEDKANGTAVINILRSEFGNINGVTPTESKVSRAYAVTTYFENGKIYFPNSSYGFNWVEELEKELTAFPSGANDDQTDALTQAITKLFGGGIKFVTNTGRIEVYR